MAAGRPKSEATIIKELQAEILEKNVQIVALETEVSRQGKRAVELSAGYFDLWIILDHMMTNAETMDEGLIQAQIKALTALVDRHCEL